MFGRAGNEPKLLFPGLAGFYAAVSDLWYPMIRTAAGGFFLYHGWGKLMGGVALGMSECDVVRRAGLPGNVNIGGGDKGERRVVLTYLSGTWPGIYTFDAGRLKVVDRAPEPAPSAKSPVKKKKAKKPVKPKTAARETERPYVQ